MTNYAGKNKEYYLECITNNKLCGGATHYRAQTIYIDKSLKINQAIKVLIHEITHVVIYVTQVNPKDYYNEEDLCEFMGMYGGYILGKAKEIVKELYNA